jgi:hypothetical protein
MSDPDRQELVPVGRLEEDDRLFADQIETDSVNEHFVQDRPLSEYSSAPSVETWP